MELYENRINTALLFIEGNLRSAFTLEQVADQAHYSKFHFMRIFKQLTGDKLGDYIRKRRITESAIDLVETQDSILNIALRYQFESQESYTRSFQSVFDVSPGYFRKKGHRHTGFEQYKLSKQHLEAIKNFIVMEPRIESIESKTLVGMKLRHNLKQFHQMIDVWKSFMPRRKEIMHPLDGNIYSLEEYEPDLTFEEFTNETMFDHWAAIEVSTVDQVPEGMQTYHVPAGDYAVFVHKGPSDTFQKTLDFIFKEWLPGSPFKYDGARPQFEIMGEKYHGPSHPNSEEDVWIPIRNK